MDTINGEPLMVNGNAIVDSNLTQHSSYQIGGSLSNDAPTYVVRLADYELQAALQRGEFCYVFNARQMGKSSLRVRAKHQLQQLGYRCASIDLSRLGSENLTLLQWYKGIMSELWRAFNLIATVDLIAWFRDHADMPPPQQLSLFVEDILLAHISTKLVILIDEIDSILSLNFSMDDFFVWIRSCYNQRAENPDYNRLTFALFGVATPPDLIQNRQRTPFNIGRAIELQGFKLAEVQPLMEGLAGVVENPKAVLKEILHWTDGQPFLTQKLCQIVLEHYQKGNKLEATKPVSVEAAESPFLHRLVQEALVHHSNIAVQIGTLVQTSVLNDWEAQDYPEHLRTILHRILKQQHRLPGLLDHYRHLLESEVLKADCSSEQVELLLSGLAVKQAGYLRVHNRIYQTVFNLEWIQETQERLVSLSACHPISPQLVAEPSALDRGEVSPPTGKHTASRFQPTEATQLAVGEICTTFIDHLGHMSQTEIEAVARSIAQRSPQAATIMLNILHHELPNPTNIQSY